jgi:predicted cupin superfamily sugar epimerase
MKMTSISTLAFTAILAVSPLAALRSEDDTRVTEIIHQLKLSVLPKESGYLGLIGSSVITTTINGKDIAVQSQVYYLLTRDRPINYLHWLAGDDTHILIEGGPVDYFIFHPDGHSEKITIGRNYAAGERPLIAVPGGCWKALRLHEGASYALMANVLSPEFTPDRVKIGASDIWMKKYVGSSPWAKPETLRTLIGPNWTGK